MTIQEMEENNWDEKSKYEVTATDTDMAEIIDAIKFMEHIKYYDKPIFIQRISYTDREHKLINFQVLGKYFIPINLEQLEKELVRLKNETIN